MTKVTYKMTEHDGRYYFNDGTGYFLIDTGFGYQSISRDGKIGPFDVRKGDRLIGWVTLDDFMGPSRPNGEKVKGVLAPMEGYSVLLRGDNTVTIDNDAQELPAHETFIPFADPHAPIIEGKCNGKPMRFFFDSGMRMAVLDDKILMDGKPRLGTVSEWIGLVLFQVDAPYYSAEYEFADGFRFDGHGEFDYSDTFLRSIRERNGNAFDAFFGIEFFKLYDLFISLIPKKRGLALLKRA